MSTFKQKLKNSPKNKRNKLNLHDLFQVDFRVNFLFNFPSHFPRFFSQFTECYKDGLMPIKRDKSDRPLNVETSLNMRIGMSNSKHCAGLTMGSKRQKVVCWLQVENLQYQFGVGVKYICKIY